MTVTCAENRLHQAEDFMLRTLNVVDVASLLGTEAFDTDRLEEPLEYFVEAVLEHPLRHQSLVPLAAVLSQAGREIEEGETQQTYEREIIRENFFRLKDAGVQGLALHFGTPVRTYTTATSYMESWGHMFTVWVYASTFEDAWEMGCKWALEQHRRARANAGFAVELWSS